MVLGIWSAKTWRACAAAKTTYTICSLSANTNLWYTDLVVQVMGHVVSLLSTEHTRDVRPQGVHAVYRVCGVCGGR